MNVGLAHMPAGPQLSAAPATDAPRNLRLCQRHVHSCLTTNMHASCCMCVPNVNTHRSTHLARAHLSNLALMQDHATNQLHIKGAQPQHTLRSLAHNLQHTTRITFHEANSHEHGAKTANDGGCSRIVTCSSAKQHYWGGRWNGGCVLILYVGTTRWARVVLHCICRR